jgi:hypothetical protein
VIFTVGVDVFNISSDIKLLWSSWTARHSR